MGATPDRVIRASELAQYGFCARAWWLGSVEGRPSTHQEVLAVGEAAHRWHGRTARAAALLSRLGYVLLGLATLLAAIGLARLL